MNLVGSFLSKKLNYIKKRFIDSALIQNWRRDVETDGFDCYSTRKLLLIAMMVVIVIMILIVLPMAIMFVSRGMVLMLVF